MVLVRKILSHKILRYGFIGALSTLIHITMAFLYIYLINDSIFLSNVVGFLCAFSFSYILQSKLVFKHKISYTKALKYFLVQSFALLLSIGISSYAPLSNSYLGVILVVAILPLITYFLHKIWTFSSFKDLN